MAGAEEEDDYMSMAILEPEQPKFETSAQKRARQKREVCLNNVSLWKRSFNVFRAPLHVLHSPYE